MNETVDPGSVADARPSPLAAPPPRRRYRLGKIALALALAAAVVLAWQYFEHLAPSTADGSKPGAPAGPPAQTVRAVAATLGDMPVIINALGTVTPLATVTVKTQVAGKLMQVGFQEGQFVKEGDFLAQIDSRPYEATLAQEQAQLAKDTSLLAQAQADLARYQTLNKQDSIAHQQVDDQTFLVAQDKAAMASDQAQIDAANLNIAYTRIVSPISGRVGLRLVDAGNYVQPSDTTGIVVITELDPISVIFSTPEDNLPRITKRLNAGAKLSVTAFDRSNVRQLGVGELASFDNQIDTTTGTFKIRANFPNPENALFPNQFVNVNLLVNTLTGAVLVPNAAIQLGANGSFVYVVKDDNTVTVRKIATGPSDATRTVISTGVAAGDKVVVDGADRLREGAKVTLAPDAVTPPEPTADAGGQHQHRRKKGAGDGATTDGATPTPTASPAATPAAGAGPPP